MHKTSISGCVVFSIREAPKPHERLFSPLHDSGRPSITSTSSFRQCLTSEVLSFSSTCCLLPLSLIVSVDYRTAFVTCLRLLPLALLFVVQHCALLGYSRLSTSNFKCVFWVLRTSRLAHSATTLSATSSTSTTTTPLPTSHPKRYGEQAYWNKHHHLLHHFLLRY